VVVKEPEVGDAWGRALLDYADGHDVATPELETDAGDVALAMHPEWFFRDFEAWDWWDRELLPRVTSGPVLDLGAGAGRASLYVQDRGMEATAVESSPGAAEVCRRRGVKDVRVADLNEPPSDRRWQTILLLCGNLGLGGSYEGTRRLLQRLSDVSADDAVVVGDTVTPTGTPEIGLRIRYRDTVTPWWRQYNIPYDEMADLVDGTGWMIDTHLCDGIDHAVLLRHLWAGVRGQWYREVKGIATAVPSSTGRCRDTTSGRS
jgi:hypothetical protein